MPGDRAWIRAVEIRVDPDGTIAVGVGDGTIVLASMTVLASPIRRSPMLRGRMPLARGMSAPATIAPTLRPAAAISDCRFDRGEVTQANVRFAKR